MSGKNETKRRTAPRNLVLPACLALLLGACGGGGDDGAGPAESAAASRPVVAERTVLGQASKGPIAFALIEVFALDESGLIADPVPVDTAVTDANGSFVLSVPAGEPLLVITSGGSYVDESDQEPDPALRRRIELNEGEGLEALLPAEASTVAVTIASQALLSQAQRDTSAAPFLEIIDVLRGRALDAYGFDILTTLPEDPTSPAGGSGEAERQYALVLGGLANVLNRVAIDLREPAPTFDILLAVVDDFSDGRIDGLLGGAPVQINGQAIRTDLDLNAEIARFRNNNFDVYPATSLPEVDSEVLAGGAVPPVAVDDEFSVPAGASLDIPAPGVLSNDRDANANPLTAALVAGPANASAFALNADGSFSYTHDDGAATSDSFTYMANDGTDDSNVATVTIGIDQPPVNQVPVAVNDAVTVVEGGTVTGNVLGNDSDPDLGPQPLTAQLLGLPANGQLVLGPDGAFSYTHDGTQTASDSFSYVAFDGSGTSNEAQVLVTVNLVDDPTLFTSIPPLTATQGVPYSYAISASDEEGPVVISAPVLPAWLTLNDNGNGTATLNGTPGNEDVGANEVVLQAAAASGPPATQSFVVDVQNVNEAPAGLELDNDVVDENAPAGTLVGVFSTLDVDAGDTHTYALVAGGPDNEFFAIAGNALQTAEVLDFETQGSLSIRVETSDGNGGSFQSSFTVTVLDQNDPPGDLTLDNQAVAENLPAGTVVGVFATVDDDAGDVHAYALVAGQGDADNGSFQIVGDELQTGAAFDFDTQSEYSIRVETSDGSAAFQKMFTIMVTDAGDNEPPTAIELSSANVNENEPAGTVVGSFATQDPNPGDTHSYALVAGAGDTDNAVFAIVGGALQTTVELDFENDGEFLSIRVQSDDGNGGVVEDTFSITLVDRNDPPLLLGLTNTEFDENLAPGSLVAVFSTIDQDAGDAHTYALVPGVGDGDNGSFEIVGDELFTTDAFDFETQPFVFIRVATTDLAGATKESQVPLTVLDVNDPPEFTSVPVTAVVQDEVYAYAVATIDQDGDPRNITADSPGLPSWLELFDNGDGTADLTGTPTAADLGLYDITLLVSDGIAAEVPQAFTIEVVAGNVAPTAAPDAATVTIGGVVEIDVVANDDDPDGGPNPLVPVVTGAPLSGVTVLTADSTLLYIHTGQVAGVDNFAYAADDGLDVSNPAQVDIQIDPPAAQTIWLIGPGLIGDGETVNVQVWADFTDEATLGGGMDFTYDPTRVTYTDWIPSTDPIFTPELGRPPIDNLNGLLEGLAVGSFDGLVGPILVGTLVFDAISSGLADFQAMQNMGEVGPFVSALTFEPIPVDFLGTSVQIGGTTDILSDPSLELGGIRTMGSPNLFWAETGTVFPPICNEPACGANLASDGTHFAWFGGVDTNQVQTLSQTTVIPPGATTLVLMATRGICFSSGTDSLAVTIDGNQAWTLLCDDTDAGYVQHAINLAGAPGGPYNDGLEHEIVITGTTSGAVGDFTNFIVDQIEIPLADPERSVQRNTIR